MAKTALSSTETPTQTPTQTQASTIETAQTQTPVPTTPTPTPTQTRTQTPTQTQAPPLDIRNLSFQFSDADVLNDVSFVVNKGDFAGLVGSNGAGKSTLLRLILGELKPSEGQIFIYGEEVDKFDGWQRIGYIAQKNADLNAGFPATVLEVVTANLYKSIGLGRPIRKVHKERAREALAKTGVADLANKRIGELSGGQQQRVFLARALVNEPELLILDEATSGVDERSQGVFYDMLDQLKCEKDLTILMVSHDMSAVTAHANRMLCLGADRFFEHDIHEALDQQFFSRLYGYEVTPHVHQHICIDEQSGAPVSSAQVNPAHEQSQEVTHA